MHRLALMAALTACLGLPRAHADAGHGAGPLHLPSPDWREQIIYFAMIDRFDDGDPGNNDQGAGEYAPEDGARYSGGDLQGLARRLDYLREIGATALWITPPVRHQWWDESVRYGGYHGYWGTHFAQVDPHFGTLADYQNLARGLHARNMYLVQDVVVNHTANHFSYPAGHDGRDPARGYAVNAGGRPQPASMPWPFSRNDARDPAQRADDIYHWTPDITDFNDPRQEHDYQLASLDDLNTGNPVVRRALRASYGHWIEQVGVDAFRIDTAFYVPPGYFADFLDADDPAAPGVRRVAARTGRDNFHVFGEGFGIDPPFADATARKIEGYVRDADGRELLPAMINFPLYGSLLDVFARGQPSAVLAHRIKSMMQVHAQPWLMPSFVDNHDVDRFLAGGSEAGLRLALLAIHTLPGIPTIYYGTEQGYTAPRAAMFARGHGAQGRDHFDPQAPLARYLRRLSDLRRGQHVLMHGTPRVLAANTAASGALLYAMQEGEEQVLVALNSATHRSLLAQVDTGLAPGTRLVPLFAVEGDAPSLRVDARGRIDLVLAPLAGFVWRARHDAGAQAAIGDEAAPQLDALARTVARDELRLRGRAQPGEALRVVLDGALDDARIVHGDARGRWQARLRTDAHVDPALEHQVMVWSEARQRGSRPQTFRVERDWRERLRRRDALGDDHGPRGAYLYPTDAAWRQQRPADLRGLRVLTSGSALRIEIELQALVHGWNAPNGFDHVALTVFLELPDRQDGVRHMPGQNAMLPDGMRWHYRLRLGGWNHALFSSEAADARHEGLPLSNAGHFRLDLARRRVILSLPPTALGSPASLDGARLYLNAWDYDGGYRVLAPQAAAFTFGGGTPNEAKEMDAIGPVRVAVPDH